ncbi:hypothetical protein BH24ACT6_BH24ACT6_20330 [soil metagenome]
MTDITRRTLIRAGAGVTDACWNLAATAGGRVGGGDAVVELVPVGLDLRRGVSAREEIAIGRGLVGTVSFGVTEPDRCRGADNGQPLGTSSWPLIAGRARARVRPTKGLPTPAPMSPPDPPPPPPTD